MNIGIKYRLFWAMLLTASIAVVCLVGMTQWNLSRGFLRFVKETERASTLNLVDALERFYVEKQSWLPLQHNRALWVDLIFRSLTPPAQEEKTGMISPPPPDTVGHPHEDHGLATKPLPPHMVEDFAQRFFLLDAEHNLLIPFSGTTEEREIIPLHNGGKEVGYLGFVPMTQLTDDRHLHFLKEQKVTFVLVAGIIVLISSIFSFLLARRLVRPLKNLTDATHKLTGGEYSSRVPAAGSDEIGLLAADFNLLAKTLELNEHARRQWVADISHELRTPIGILRGETEALIDGVRTPSAAALQSLHAESLQLQRLVDDLYQLSMSDLGALSYRKTELDLAATVEDIVESYRGGFDQHGLKLTLTHTGTAHVVLFADPDRLRQLFSNLLDNALKYTDAGGQLDIKLCADAQKFEVHFHDSAPGVAESDLEKLFERLYRIESSRNRSTGGTGLGLAICRNIVAAHQGTISAHPSVLGGLWIKVVLPLKGDA